MSAAAFSASSFLELYQMATLAPASARACATPNPMPELAPETMAVLPLREKRGSTRLDWGTSVASCANLPPFMSAMLLTVVMEGWMNV